MPQISARPVGMGLSRAAWVKLNRLQTVVGQFHLSMHKWGLAPSPNCKCGTSEQTTDHVLTACPIHRAPHGARGLTILDDETRCWLITSLPASDLGSAAVWGSKRINPWPQSCLCLTWSGYPSNDDNNNDRTPGSLTSLFSVITLDSCCLTVYDSCINTLIKLV